MMNEVTHISQHLVNSSLPTKLGDGTRYGAMLDEYSIHLKALNVLHEATKQDKKMGISAMFLATYVLELGLKCLSYLSHDGNIFLITSNDFNSRKNFLPTGIYKISQGKHTYYKNIVCPDTPYLLKRRDGTKVKNNKTGAYELIDNRLMESKLSQDELFAIFENYTPYPQTHIAIDIFKSIKSEYQQDVYNNFKKCFCYYLMNNTTFTTSNYSVESVEALQFDKFEEILNSMHNLYDFRYMSAGNGNVQAHGGLLSSLNNAVCIVLLNAEQANSIVLNSSLSV